MLMFAQRVIDPGATVACVVAGLLAGWLASKVMGGGGYGLIVDMVLGLIGAAAGGFVFGLLMGRGTDPGGDTLTMVWGSFVVAFLGAYLLLVGSRFLGLGRSA